MKLTRTLPLAFIACLTSSLGLLESAMSSTTSQTAQGPRQFDFWVGDWECRTQTGQLAGTNRIEKILGDRVLQENWEGSGGTSGKSFNIFDAATGMWHQTWVDDSGTLLQLDGGLTEDGSMVLEGMRPGPNGSDVLHRVTWTPMDGGRVNQVWDSSADGGGAWTNLVDLVYSPAPEKAPEAVPGESGKFGE